MSDIDEPGARLQIGDVAERVGLSLRTVRYYEEQGLIVPAGRTPGGFRLYTEGQVDRLQLIKQMKPLGFMVQQMCELLTARDDLAHPAADRRRKAEKDIAAFATDAAERCERLREQLRGAEDLAHHLHQCLPAAGRHR